MTNQTQPLRCAVLIYLREQIISDLHRWANFRKAVPIKPVDSNAFGSHNTFNSTSLGSVYHSPSPMFGVLLATTYTFRWILLLPAVASIDAGMGSDDYNFPESGIRDGEEMRQQSCLKVYGRSTFGMNIHKCKSVTKVFVNRNHSIPGFIHKGVSIQATFEEDFGTLRKCIALFVLHQ
jgi:hypothetical protein